MFFAGKVLRWNIIYAFDASASQKQIRPAQGWPN